MEKEFNVIRYWEVRDEVRVLAETAQEAIDKAHALPLTQNTTYVPDSINSDVDDDVQEIH